MHSREIFPSFFHKIAICALLKQGSYKVCFEIKPRWFFILFAPFAPYDYSKIML